MYGYFSPKANVIPLSTVVSLSIRTETRTVGPRRVLCWPQVSSVFSTSHKIRKKRKKIRQKLKPIFNQWKLRQRKDRDGFDLSFNCPRYSWLLSPTAPMATSQWETITFISYVLKVTLKIWTCLFSLSFFFLKVTMKNRKARTELHGTLIKHKKNFRTIALKP